MTNVIILTLPLPAKALSPNARVHWAALSSAKKKARMQAKLVASIEQDRLGGPLRWEAARVEAWFLFRENRNRDKDNLIASLKAYLDGIADAGLVLNDSGLTPMPPIIGIDKANPRLSLRFTRIEKAK